MTTETPKEEQQTPPTTAADQPVELADQEVEEVAGAGPSGSRIIHQN